MVVFATLYIHYIFAALLSISSTHYMSETATQKRTINNLSYVSKAKEMLNGLIESRKSTEEIYPEEIAKLEATITSQGDMGTYGLEKGGTGIPSEAITEMREKIKQASSEREAIQAILDQHRDDVGNAIKAVHEYCDMSDINNYRHLFQEHLGKIALSGLFDLLPELEVSAQTRQEMIVAIWKDKKDQVMKLMLQNLYLLQSGEIRILFQDTLEGYLADEEQVKSVSVNTEGAVVRVEQYKGDGSLQITVESLADSLSRFSLGKIYVQGADDESGRPTFAKRNGLPGESAISGRAQGSVRALLRSKENLVKTLLEECFKHPDPYRVFGVVISRLQKAEQEELLATLDRDDCKALNIRTIRFEHNIVTYGEDWEVESVEEIAPFAVNHEIRTAENIRHWTADVVVNLPSAIFRDRSNEVLHESLKWGSDTDKAIVEIQTAIALLLQKRESFGRHYVACGIAARAFLALAELVEIIPANEVVPEGLNIHATYLKGDDSKMYVQKVMHWILHHETARDDEHTQELFANVLEYYVTSSILPPNGIIFRVSRIVIDKGKVILELQKEVHQNQGAEAAKQVEEQVAAVVDHLKTFFPEEIQVQMVDDSRTDSS